MSVVRYPTVKPAPLTSSTVTAFNVRDYGAQGNGTTDDTAAINAAMSAARVPGGKRGGVVRIPAGVYQISAPINLYDNVHVIGDSAYFDPTFYNASILRATVGFTGSAMMLQNPDGNTIGGGVPDESYHFGLIDRVCFFGNGITGPHGLDPGWNGEATIIRNCSFTECNSGIYLSGPQASATIEDCSMFANAIGLNCDDITSSVRVLGISGDNNTNLIRVKGGVSTNVTVFGMKAESYVTGKGDPVIKIEDLAGGAFTLVGGWADTDAARTAVIGITQPGASSQRPKVMVMGMAANSLYTNLINDTFDGHAIPIGYGGSNHPLIAYNVSTGVLGGGDLGIGYGRTITGLQFGETDPMNLVSSGASNQTVFYAGPGAGGGNLTDATGATTLLQWRKNGFNNIGFYGADPVTKQTVTGSRGGNAALASLLTALANLGLVTDSSS
jgi:hypothetical protein